MSGRCGRGSVPMGVGGDDHRVPDVQSVMGHRRVLDMHRLETGATHTDRLEAGATHIDRLEAGATCVLVGRRWPRRGRMGR